MNKTPFTHNMELHRTIQKRKVYRGQSSKISTGWTRLDIPFDRKEFAKMHGAIYRNKQWWVTGPVPDELAAFLSKNRIYLNIPYNERHVGKTYGAIFCWQKKKWFVNGSVPPELERFTEGSTERNGAALPDTDGAGLAPAADKSACVYCANARRPPACRVCNRCMVSDCWTGAEDDEAVVIIHDCVGSPMMLGGTCLPSGQCRNRRGVQTSPLEWY